jgi:transposase-like protein
MKKRSNKGKSRAERTRGEGYEPVLVADKPKRIKMGRPTDFSDTMIDEAATMARHGATDHEISEALGIRRSTIYVWRDKYPEFANALAEGKAVFDDRIERSLAERAKGYEYTAEKVFSNGQRAVVTEHVPADVGAGVRWLVQRKRWKPDSVLGELGLLPDDAQGASQAEIGVRALAIGALALLGAAAHNSQQPATIDVTPNRQEETDDGEDNRDPATAQRSEGPSRDAGARSPHEHQGHDREPDDRDPDFDF